MQLGQYRSQLKPEVLLKTTNLALLNPVLAAIFPVMFLYAENVDEVGIGTFSAVLGLVLLASAVIFSVAWIIFRDHVRTGFLAAAWILLFFAAGHVFDELLGRSLLGFEISRYRHLALITAAYAGLTLYLSIWKPKICTSITPYISAIFGFLILFNVLSIVVHSIDGPDSGTPEPSGLAELDLDEVKPDNLPDIYYIILDSYPRGDVLQETFGFDNSEFLGSLEGSGFFVGTESRANYVHTFLSISSSLNMAHMSYLSEVVGESSTDTRIPKSLVRNSEVVRFAEGLGYKIAHLSSESALIDWLDGRSSVDIDVDRPSLGRYPLGMLGRTLLRPVVGNDFGFTLFSKTLLGHASVTHRRSSVLGSIGEYVDQWIRANRASTYLGNLNKLVSISNDEGPTFTLAHFLPPHPPYLFDSEGNIPYGRVDFSDWRKRDLYLDQLLWVNNTILDAVRQIQKNDNNNSVIVIQGDHGTLSTDNDRVFNVGGEPSAELVNERSAILNTYFLPSSCQHTELYPSITPVNSFRVIFNNCFGTNLKLLKDQSHWSSYHRPYDFNLVDELLERK